MILKLSQTVESSSVMIFLNLVLKSAVSKAILNCSFTVQLYQMIEESHGL